MSAKRFCSRRMPFEQWRFQLDKFKNHLFFYYSNKEHITHFYMYIEQTRLSNTSIMENTYKVG